MAKAKLIVDRDFQIAPVDERMYGSFIEHLGRAVYTGIYQPGHESADEEGFRQDVIDLVKELNVPIVRYPGGNFVSNFYWEDSVGPKAERKPRLDLAWRTLEPNEIGIQEFARWAKKVGTKPMMAVNLGTRGVEAALNLLEYCNLNTDSHYANLRRLHGDEKPYDIKLWCMGNEMDGPWQAGHKTAREYGKLAAETAKAMKMMDDSIECVVCGSSNKNMPTFGTWEEEVLDETYDYVDYVSLHTYWSNAAGDTPEFFAQNIDLEEFIETVIHICDLVKAKKHSKKQINLSFDEWNVWYHSNASDDADMKNLPWRRHPHLLEDIYTYEDAIVDGLALITFLKHADRVKIAALAQLVNVIAPIMTEEDGKAWRQTIFYPFFHASKYGRGISLTPIIRSSEHATSHHEHVNDVDAAAVWNEEKQQLTVFAVNRCLEEKADLSIDMRGFEGYQLSSWEALESDDLLAVNSAAEEKVHPIRKEAIEQNSYELAPASWNVLVFSK
ncbi:MAG: alpha-N-arabinofuranosidase [Firmicutes bacterium]|nr:alpha-N-arabinofuranosidase [Bacillota bacterium]